MDVLRLIVGVSWPIATVAIVTIVSATVYFIVRFVARKTDEQAWRELAKTVYWEENNRLNRNVKVISEDQRN
jgi:heme/copper-type cytochrome/quinol oxidase subunit 2